MKSINGFPVLPPGSIIGIIGGGQLGRMTAIAAARLGYRCHVFSPDDDAPAKEVAPFATTAFYDDIEAVEAFAKSVDVVTFEFENVPDDALARIALQTPVRPGIMALQVSQDRIKEKSFFTSLGIDIASWHPVQSPDSLQEALQTVSLPAILKTARLGYDGRGQVRLHHKDEAAEAWKTIGTVRAVLEEVVEFEREISVIVARSLDGGKVSWDPVDNVHRNHILHTTSAPSTLPRNRQKAAVEIAGLIADELEITGLLAVEMFVLGDGRLLVNEIAPRPHNSGHWTLDACAIDQFEQLVRAVTGLPLGDPRPHSAAVMTNLIGSEIDNWQSLLRERGACVHLYGKSEVRTGRKMGHVTRLSRNVSRP